MIRFTTKTMAALAVAGAMFGPTLASAAPIGYSLSISGDTNVPTFALTNTGGAGALDIVGFVLEIKEPSRGIDPGDSNFDVSGGAAAGLTVNEPTGGAHSQTIDFSYTGLSSGNTHTFTADHDGFPSGDTVYDYRSILFNNGADDNAMLTITFDGGSQLMQTLADQSGSAPFVFSQSGDGDPGTVSEPAVLALLGAAVLGVAGIRRRK